MRRDSQLSSSGGATVPEPRGSPNSMSESLPVTEERNPRSAGIDLASTEQVLAVINAEDGRVAAAVQAQIPQIARALDAIVDRWDRGGRLFYCGAGTSGRLGVLDAAECPPTFGTPPERVVGLIAGGPEALLRSIEGAEDLPEAAHVDLEQRGFCGHDALVGIAASGRTPYVLGAVEHAAKLGAVTVGLTCNPGSPLERAVEYPITPEVGSEVVTGSTRMKSGTAQKLVLNMLSTGLMIRTGCVLGNLMVNVQVKNAKLANRAERIVGEVCSCDLDSARTALESAGHDVRLAILMLKQKLGRGEAKSLLARFGDNLRRALETSDD